MKVKRCTMGFFFLLLFFFLGKRECLAGDGSVCTDRHQT